MKRRLSAIFAALFCCLIAGAQPLAKLTPLHGNHHTQRLPGVNERRLARLEKMRQANSALRHWQGPWRASAQPQTKKGLVLLVEFSDVKMKSGAATTWNDRFNQEGFTLDRHVGSVRDYFIEQSYGMLTIDFDVVGPYTLDNTRTYYGSSPGGNLDDRAAQMVIDALKKADSQVNYKDYDWDNDGYVDQVYVIYAGITKYATQGYIWPHEWSLSSAKYYGSGSGRQRLDNVYLDTYAVSNELANSTTVEGIGTACHEFSHCLGYPDFYDADYTGGTAGQNWDVLDAGSYNGPRNIGEIPSPYTAYERWTAGWIDLIPLTEPCRVRDMPAINEEGTAYIIKNTGNTNEYYILENRQQVTFGKGNGGHGLMVWHIDYNQAAWSNNQVNTNKDHQRMTFVPADGKVGDLVDNEDGTFQYSISPDDEAGDPYPGKQGVTSVPQLTWFISERNGTKKHANLIHTITESPSGKISFTYGNNVALPTPEITEPSNIMYDSFTANWLPVEGATSYNLEVEVMTGQESPSTILGEDFADFNSVAVDATITNSVIDKYTKTKGWEVSTVFGTKEASVRIGSNGAIGYVMTPVLENRQGKLIVEFDASYYSTDASSVVVTVMKDNESVATQIVKITDNRATYTCNFEDVPSGCKVKLSSTARRKRFYLYNVNIMDMSGAGYKLLSYTGLTTTSFTINQTEPALYYYRVQAVSAEGESDWTDWMDVDMASPIATTSAKGASENEIYDLQGRRLQRVPQHGFYIMNGKTYFSR